MVLVAAVRILYCILLVLLHDTPNRGSPDTEDVDSIMSLPSIKKKNPCLKFDFLKAVASEEFHKIKYENKTELVSEDVIKLPTMTTSQPQNPPCNMFHKTLRCQGIIRK